MSLSRRSFLQSAAAVTSGFAGLQLLSGQALGAPPSAAGGQELGAGFGYGPLRVDPYGVLDLPAGFTYRTLARQGQIMDDGLLFGGQPDGAAAFPGPDGTTVLIVNHELAPELFFKGPFGVRNELLSKIDPAKLYDTGHGKTPGLGGTSTIHYDTRTGQVVKRFMSLAGTERNCAGGPTPWNTWISCEETVSLTDELRSKDHGFCFEVPADATGLVDPVPIKPMGRFFHEAVAVDPESGIVYLTEDLQDGAFYRYIPDEPGALMKGGRLQALAVRDKRSADLRNWVDAVSADEAARTLSNSAHTAMKAGDRSPHETPVQQAMDVAWVDVEDALSPQDDMRYHVYDKGAARFARGEGCWFGEHSVYFACTSGGHKRQGQVFHYLPSPYEGTAMEQRFPGRLELYLEPNDSDLLNNCDNVTIAPWGDLILCEDAKDANDVVGVTAKGEYYKLAHNALSRSEFAGACFSPDGSTLFLSIQGDGLVLAITGPWARGRG